VQAFWFQADGFFDARDLVQVKYEMLRHVNTEGAKKAEAAELFGLSRPTYYQAEAAFAQQGLAGLLPQRRGPRRPHKLTAEVMTFIETKMMDEHPLAARALTQAIRTELGLSIHPRSIERALARKKNPNTHRGSSCTAVLGHHGIRTAARRSTRRARAPRRARSDRVSRPNRGTAVTVFLEQRGVIPRGAHRRVPTDPL
jgi:transposase